MRTDFYLFLLAFSLIAFGCAERQVSDGSRPGSIADPIQVKSADLSVALIGIIGLGDEATLVRDRGWHEYILEFENLSKTSVTVANVKLLNSEGRYVDSASAYEQVTAPPDVGTELAGDAAVRAAGMAAGKYIPFGGSIFSVLSGAASASADAAKKNAESDFSLRVLKNVELGPGGKMKGSAFLPNIERAQSLAIDYTRIGTAARIEIPLPLN